jgi:hypothetical protein
MPAFKRLTREDLTRLTRAELLDWITVESDYWDRKCKRGLNEADATAHQEFSSILHAAFDPSAALNHAITYIDGRGDNGYWNEKPGA